MIKAVVKIENEWKKGEVRKEEIEFQKIGEIEDYLAYNRAYIRAIEFVGKIEDKEEE